MYLIFVSLTDSAPNLQTVKHIESEAALRC